MRAMLLGLLASAALLGIVGEAHADSEHRANRAPDLSQCGVYMYWQNGKCVDARDRPSGKSWGDEMLQNLGKWHG